MVLCNIFCLHIIFLYALSCVNLKRKFTKACKAVLFHYWTSYYDPQNVTVNETCNNILLQEAEKSYSDEISKQVAPGKRSHKIKPDVPPSKVMAWSWHINFINLHRRWITLCPFIKHGIQTSWNFMGYIKFKPENTL